MAMMSCFNTLFPATGDLQAAPDSRESKLRNLWFQTPSLLCEHKDSSFFADVDGSVFHLRRYLGRNFH